MFATPATASDHDERALVNMQTGQPAVVHSLRSSGRMISQMLRLISDKVPVQRIIVHARDHVYQAGGPFENLFIINSGMFKVVSASPDGREQVVAVKFRGDWLGFDGLAHNEYTSDAIAMDTGEVWAVRYESLLDAGLADRSILTRMHQAMSRDLARERDSLMSVCTLSGDARVADFLCYWADCLDQRGMRTDQISLRMTRAEIGNYLGLTLESVSRALSRLARAKLISFEGKGRRDLSIPDVSALATFVQDSLTPPPALHSAG